MLIFYPTTTVKHRDGTTYTGKLTKSDCFSVIMIDVTITRKDGTVSHSECVGVPIEGIVR